MIPVPDSNERDSQRHDYSGGNGADFIKEPFARNNLFLLDGLHEQGVWPWFMQDKAAHCFLAQRKINRKLVTLPCLTISHDGLPHVFLFHFPSPFSSNEEFLAGILHSCYTMAEGISPLERTQHFAVIYDAI
ncbi:hypothetical protein [Mitsuokella multacida]|uniref:hypothetical protein n=1 Tax=Mitsuokella multacida TaxID=52226 RepID=UPI0022DFC610|nr:hypothetical protein [Mitsuokella multacida]